MAYNANLPADNGFIADGPGELRENFRALKEDKIVNAGKLKGLEPGHASGNIPVSDGTLNAGLNADQLDGHDSAYFSADGHVHSAATPTSNGFMSNTDKAKLDGIAAGAEVNQNAFAKVKAGDVTVEADQKSDTLELVAGNAIAITPDAANDKVTIAVNGDFLPLNGGVLRGNVDVKTDYNDGSGNSFTGPLIRVATTNTQYGNHVAIGGGSSTVIGGGEAVAAQLNELVGADSENAYVVADSKVIIKTNGNTWANAKTMEFGTDGSLTVSKVNGALNGNANSATKATQDSRGQQIDSTYIKGLSVNGRTVTYTRGNGTTGSFQTQDTNTTYTLASLGAPMAPTSNNWKRINISNGRCTLPGGGTWAYAMIAQQSTATITILDKVGVAAGGTTIQTSNQIFSVGYVLVWRIA